MRSELTYLINPFFAVRRHPIQYHNANSGANPWRKVLTNYLVPAVAISVVTNIPKFMEIKLDRSTVTESYFDEASQQHIEVREGLLVGSGQ